MNDPQTTETQHGGFDRPVIAFFLLAYGIAWGLWLVLSQFAAASGVETEPFLRMIEAQDFGATDPALPGWLLYLLTRIQDFAFSIAGVTMIIATAGRQGLRELGSRLVRFRFGPGWYLLALLPIALFGAAVLISGASAEVTGEKVGTALFSIEAGLLVSLFLRGAMGEELGLRGFALPRLQAGMTPYRASLIIGLLWGLWHLPVLLGRGPASIVLFLTLAIGLSFIFTLLFNGSRGSLVPVLLFHATQNWEEGFETFFPALVGTDWETPSTLALIVIGLIAGIVVWRRGSAPPETRLG